jgi:hypothetical protein
MSRIDLQIDRVGKKLGNGINQGVILSEMNAVQMDLCRDYLALKKEIDIILESGVERYDLGSRIFKIKETFEPTEWARPLEFVFETERWNEIRKRSVSTYAYPQKAFIWNNWLRLWPVSTIVTGDAIELLVYALPSKDLTFGGDPELGINWDESLYLGTLLKIAGGDWKQAYEEEAEKQMYQGQKEAVKGFMKRSSFIDELGF